MNPDSTTSPPPDRRSFAILAREHHRGLLVYGRALAGNEATAADLVQDAFVTAWKNLSRFDVTRDFGSWMRGIVRNKWREYLRRHRREVDVDDATLEVWESRFITWDDGRNSGHGDLFELLENCLARLPEPMREAVDRFYYQDAAGESVADSLGIDTATLRKRLQRSREALRNCLEQKHQNHS
jgi:RNA polymerase sigma factor (sigma-70 family)